MIYQSLKPIKKGDTFSLSCTSDVDVNLMTITSQIRTDRDAVVASLVVTKTGQFTFTLTTTSTSAWPIGQHICDIQILEGGITRSTDSFIVPIIADVTR